MSQFDTENAAPNRLTMPALMMKSRLDPVVDHKGSRRAFELLGSVDKQYLLFIILLTFSILLPVAKIILLFRFWHEDSATRQQLERFMNWLSHYGKWSMLDVFVVALLVVIVKLGVLATVEVHYGIYLYAAAGLLIMMTTSLVNNVAKEELKS